VAGLRVRTANDRDPVRSAPSHCCSDGPLASIEASRPLRSQLIPAVSAPVVDECSSKLYYSENGTQVLSLVPTGCERARVELLRQP